MIDSSFYYGKQGDCFQKLNKHFEEVRNEEKFIPSFDCSWNFVSVKGMKYE